MRIALIFSLILSVLAVVFALQNNDTIAVNLLFFETRGSAALVLIVTFALGVLVGLLSTLPGRIRDKRTIKKFKKGTGAESGAASSSFTMPKSSTGASRSSGASNAGESSGSSVSS